jgi:hydrogenase-4 component E
MPVAPQLINLFASVLLLLSFAMLSQRRIVTLINLFAAQGLALVGSTATVALATGQTHLLYSAAITFCLKVLLLPYILHRLIRRLNVKWDIETLINIPMMMLVGIVLVVFAFNLALPISEFSRSIARGTLGIALDVLVGMVILGVFLFQIREQFDSLDIHHLEKLRDE